METKASNQENKNLVVQALITKIEEENKESEIKTSLVEGFKKPERIVRDGDARKGYTPDIISTVNGKIDLYEVELDPSQDDIVDKWRLFSVYTDQSKGNLTIVTPKNKLDQIKEMLKENHIRARILYFA